ncbi:MAG: YdcF family protein [Clostridiales bacterium]|nr:YdcF family protein [Clostridiales bacterium]
MKYLNVKKNFLRFMFVIIGAALLIWYLAPLASNIFNIGNALGTAVSIFLIIFGIFFNKIPKIPRSVIIAVICMVIVVCIPLTANMIKYSNYKTDSGAQTVIVLGCKVNSTVPSKYLYNRCSAAAEYMKDNPLAVAVLSGGQGADEQISEAQCMENVLVKMGIDKNRLYKEDKSTDTRENIKFSSEIINRDHLSKEVVVVTNEFHEYRAKLICDDNGLDFHSKCSYSSKYTLLTYYTRELMGIIKELIF